MKRDEFIKLVEDYVDACTKAGADVELGKQLKERLLALADKVEELEQEPTPVTPQEEWWP